MSADGGQADFYQRIYMHRIENCLDTATAKKGIKRFIEKIIKQVRSRQSHGIPVGGTASRIIAEAILADTDNALADEGFRCSRFVDDFRIFVQPGQNPYTILAFLADQLAASEGLSLNAQKTKLFSKEEFQTIVGEQTGDVFDEAEKNAIQDLSQPCSSRWQLCLRVSASTTSQLVMGPSRQTYESGGREFESLRARQFARCPVRIARHSHGPYPGNREHARPTVDGRIATYHGSVMPNVEVDASRAFSGNELGLPIWVRI